MTLLNLDGGAQHVFPPGPAHLTDCFECQRERRPPNEDGELPGALWARQFNGRKEEQLVSYCEEHAAIAIARATKERAALHGRRTADTLLDDRDYKGLVGETSFAYTTGLPVDLRTTGSDGGTDFCLQDGSGVDVKCTTLDPPQWRIPVRALVGPTRFWLLARWPSGARKEDKFPTVFVCGMDADQIRKAPRVDLNGASYYGVTLDRAVAIDPSGNAIIFWDFLRLYDLVPLSHDLPRFCKHCAKYVVGYHSDWRCSVGRVDLLRRPTETAFTP